MRFQYTTRNSIPWFFLDGNWYLAQMVEITDIKWDHQVTVGRCQYCGHDYTGEECPGCAARRKDKIYEAGVAIVKMRAIGHPDNLYVLSLPTHWQITYSLCGRIDDRDNIEWLLDMTNCKTITKGIPNPSSLRDETAIFFDVTFQCDATLIDYRERS